MNVNIFPTGTGSAQSAINYLLSDKDHLAKIRSIQPEIIYGDPETFVAIADATFRKHKYTSGAIAFRDNETITEDQIHTLISTFRSTFLPGLKPDENYADFWVLHRDKGNIELHFLFSNTELSSSQQLNIHPPGQKNIEFFNTFVSLTNHAFGFAQVVPDPLKEALKPFEPRQPANGKKYKKDGTSLAEKLHTSIINGTISSRDQLLNYITKQGVEINRVGADYITVQIPGAKKGVRVYGDLFRNDGDYKAMVHAHHQSKIPKYLTTEEAQTQQLKLTQAIHARYEFNRKRYLTPKPGAKRNKAERALRKTTSTTKTYEFLSETAKAEINTVLQKQLHRLNSQSPIQFKLEIKTINPQLQTESNQNDRDDLKGSDIGSNSTGNLEMQIGALSLQYHTLLIQLGNGSAKGKRAQAIRAKITALEAKLSALNIELQKQKAIQNCNKPKI
jgi:hypothetical protein